MKSLDSFTVERLEKISTSAFYYAGAEMEEIQALAIIALAAKRAEPVAYWNDACDLDDGAFSYANDAGCTRPLYTTPPLPAEPVAYADRQAFENFRNGTATKEWMWADPDSGLIALYITPQLNSPQLPSIPAAWEVKGILCHTKEEADSYVGEPAPLYDAPQLNSAEIPEGWKLVPNMPTLGMLSVLGLTGSFESMLGRYADMLYAAPEKPL